uniref:Uncharacterized protein n=1 Tax=Chromera velia CCMP2878 TaxID=1169474 RepID=A0A0G4FAE0_9ALVE|eukprot:Cvel_3003.t1-p1 / transcript=Cvel_3003.t1 / gene=Cvel_3003 / organism=Chromera_velia_CCMP2878 / gene_product=hypothetical protein / transcript_product=hypothetical protein / location=Cvel_scaffold119:109209-112968(+) / protein_length=710 / sequence_SO=supercontig / SO=protein_coding / is_pseudo=false
MTRHFSVSFRTLFCLSVLCCALLSRDAQGFLTSPLRSSGPSRSSGRTLPSPLFRKSPTGGGVSFTTNRPSTERARVPGSSLSAAATPSAVFQRKSEIVPSFCWLVTATACAATVYLNNYRGFGPVKAAGAFGLLSALQLSPEYARFAFAGCMAGMSSPNCVPDWRFGGFLGVMTANILMVFNALGLLKGVGGRLGAAAVTGCVIGTSLLSRLPTGCSAVGLMNSEICSRLFTVEGVKEAVVSQPEVLGATLAGAVAVRAFLAAFKKIDPLMRKEWAVASTSLTALIANEVAPLLGPAAIAGGFVGMSSEKLISNFVGLPIAALGAGVVQLGGAGLVQGVGGRLGAAAALSVVCTRLLFFRSLGALLSLVRSAKPDSAVEVMERGNKDTSSASFVKVNGVHRKGADSGTSVVVVEKEKVGGSEKQKQTQQGDRNATTATEGIEGVGEGERLKEEEEKRKSEEEEDGRKRKEEEERKKRDEDEKKRKEEEERKKREEDERKRKEEEERKKREEDERKKKEEERRKREEDERKRKEEEEGKKREEDERKRKEEEERTKREEEKRKKKEEEEKRVQEEKEEQERKFSEKTDTRSAAGVFSPLQSILLQPRALKQSADGLFKSPAQMSVNERWRLLSGLVSGAVSPERILPPTPKEKATAEAQASSSSVKSGAEEEAPSEAAGSKPPSRAPPSYTSPLVNMSYNERMRLLTKMLQ